MLDQEYYAMMRRQYSPPVKPANVQHTSKAESSASPDSVSFNAKNVLHGREDAEMLVLPDELHDSAS